MGNSDLERLEKDMTVAEEAIMDKTNHQRKLFDGINELRRRTEVGIALLDPLNKNYDGRLQNGEATDKTVVEEARRTKENLNRYLAVEDRLEALGEAFALRVSERSSLSYGLLFENPLDRKG